jgi:chromosome segregation ATPase
LDKFADKLMEYYAGHESTINEDLEKVRHNRAAVSKQVNNIVEAIANGGNNFSSLKEKLSSLESQLSECEKKIAELESTKQFSIPKKADIKKYLSTHGDISKMDRPALKAYLNEKIRDIRVFPDQIDVDSIVNPIGCGRPYTITFTIAV